MDSDIEGEGVPATAVGKEGPPTVIAKNAISLMSRVRKHR